MGGEWRSSTGDSWALDVDEGGAGGASSGPGSEVGAPHRTAPVPAPHRRWSAVEKAGLVGVVASSGSAVDLHAHARHGSRVTRIRASHSWILCWDLEQAEAPWAPP
jgi:hypothetical protein